jgi:hypothetical protein
MNGAGINLTKISKATGMDLTKISTRKLLELETHLMKIQRYGGGYDKQLEEIADELAKPERAETTLQTNS